MLFQQTKQPNYTKCKDTIISEFKVHFPKIKNLIFDILMIIVKKYIKTRNESYNK